MKEEAPKTVSIEDYEELSDTLINCQEDIDSIISDHNTKVYEYNLDPQLTTRKYNFEILDCINKLKKHLKQ